MSDLQRLCDNLNVRIDCTFGAKSDAPSDLPKTANGFRVVLKYQRRQLTADIWMGGEREPTAADVISCMLSDGFALDETFEDWCSGLGYNSDSIKAKHTYEGCRANGRKIKRLLGSDFDRFARAEH